MPVPSSYETVPDSDLALALESALLAPACAVTREGSCYLASIGAAHIMNRLAAAGFIVVRPAERAVRLDV